MGFITYPDVFQDGQVLTGAEIERLKAAIAAVVNGNLDTNNLSPNAGIVGAQVAPGTLDASRLTADAGISGEQLEAGAALRATGVGDAAWAFFSTTETVLATTTALATRGGPVIILGSFALTVAQVAGGAGQIVLRLYRDGVVGTHDAAVIFTKGFTPIVTTGVGGASIPLDVGLNMLDSPAAGSHVYKVTAVTTTHLQIASTLAGGKLSALELS